MVLERSLKFVLDRLGHDGSEIVWPSLPEPFCRRAFHIQELIDVCWFLNHTVTPFEALPVSQGRIDAEPKDVCMSLGRMDTIMKDQVGVITGATFLGHPHAVAWNGERCYDPNGTIYEINRFQIGCFWAIKSM